ncbi:MAG: acyltransferase [Chthoniobacteraceae bacterium]
MSSRSGEIRALTGIRGVAALTVAAAHFDLTTYFPQWSFIGRLFFWHNPAVDLFFMLSAFVLCHVYTRVSLDSQVLRHYFSARFARIYPLYFVTFLFVLFLGVLAALKRGAFADDLTLADALRQVFVINAWPFIGTNHHWNFPAWSISAEVFCYCFIFPFLWQWRDRWLRLSIPVLTFLVVLLLAGDYVLVDFFEQSVQPWNGEPILRGGVGFGIGTCVFALHRQNALPARFAPAASIFFAAFFLTILVLSSWQDHGYARVMWAFPFLIISLSEDISSPVAAFLGSRPVHYLGEISYSIYLWHFPVAKTFDGLFPKFMAPGTPYHPAIIFLLIATVLLAAVLSYECFEKPFRRILRGRLAHSHAARDEGSSAIKRPASPELSF